MVVLTIPIETEGVSMSGYSHCRELEKSLVPITFFKLLDLVIYSYVFYSYENVIQKRAPQLHQASNSVHAQKS